MMRIAYACLDPGVPLDGSKGASVHVRAMIRALAARGHAVAAVAARGEGRVPGAASIEIVGIGDARLAEAERGLKRSRAGREAIAGLADRAPIGAVYERLSLFSTGPGEAARSVGVPHVLEVNAPLSEEAARYRGLSGADAAAALRAESDAISRADAVLAVSSALAEHAVALGARPERVSVVPNAVDPEIFFPRPRPPRGKGSPFTVGFVGGLRPWHGLDVLADALGLAARAGLAHWRACVVGDGPGRKPFAERVLGAGFPEASLELAGAVAHEDVPGYLARFDAAVVPYADLPGFYFSPLKLYEALAAGVPVAAAAAGDVPEALRHGAFGRLVAPGDPRALFAALREIDLGPEAALASAALAADAVRAERTWERNARAVESAVAAASPRIGAP